MPAIAAAEQGDHPDAELLELGREYMAVEREIKAADAHSERCQAAYDEHEPTPRDVMRHRIEDHLGGYSLPMSFSTRCLAADPQYNAFYSEDEIDLLRERPPAEDPAEQARVHAILEEWDRWSEECTELRIATGLNAATEAEGDIIRQQQVIVDKIVTMPATTFAGLAVRTRLLQRIYDELELEDVGYNTNHHDLVRALMRDLAAFVEQAA